DRDERGRCAPGRFDAGGDKPRFRRRDRDEPLEPPVGRPRRGHAWRSEDSPLRTHYKGERSETGKPSREEPTGPKRAGLLTDRKGRKVLVERFGEAKPEAAEPPKRAFRGK
ncbi:hypothetical protein CH338_31240, partial [Rhodoplanes elegans]